MKPFEEQRSPLKNRPALSMTHKTASSTMLNILFWFAECHYLMVALPKGNDTHFDYPNLFTSDLVDPHTKPPNIITNHMRFNKKELEKLMPPDTVYITIMREPSAMFESLFDYFYPFCQSMNRVPNRSISEFLDNSLKYYRLHEGDSMFAQKCLTFDLGGDKDSFHMDYGARLAAQVEETFSLVMISDCFDESLILLRHLLNWDWTILSKSNMRLEKARKKMSPELSAKIRAKRSVPKDVDIVGYELATDLSAERQALCTKFVMPEPPYMDAIRKA